METETQFQIKQQSFEGPIEVLLELIEKRKIFVNDVSLAVVTDDFISYIQTKGVQAEQVADFLSVAATLILIKARSLLPNIELTPEENESIGDLERRLALYKIISDISVELIKNFGKKISFGGISRSSGPVFVPDPKIDINQLSLHLKSMIDRVPPKTEANPEVRLMPSVSIGEVISTLQDRIEKIISCNFSDIRVNSPGSDQKSQKIYTIVSFLGMLELVRRGLVMAEQEDQFKDIKLQQHNHEI